MSYGHANPPERHPGPPAFEEDYCEVCGKNTGAGKACWCRADELYEEARDNALLERMEDEER